MIQSPSLNHQQMSLSVSGPVEDWSGIYANLLLLVQGQRKSFLISWLEFTPKLREVLEEVRMLGEEFNDDRLRIITKAIDRGVIVTNYIHYYDDDLRNLVELYRNNGSTISGRGQIEPDTQRLLENIVSVPRSGGQPYQLTVNQRPFYNGWANNDQDGILNTVRNSLTQADPTLGQQIGTNWLGQSANSIGRTIGSIGSAIGGLGGTSSLGGILGEGAITSQSPTTQRGLLGSSVNPNWNQTQLTPPLDRSFDQGYSRGMDLVRRSLSGLF